ncbi:centrosomal protein of 19 kDa-like [Amphiura filiformis]|uniref:centrosomal protein of 19 kDa-like n=1 Tax=Amphiura filiformis TaxID=82378 RepID=UPI003B20C3CF
MSITPKKCGVRVDPPTLILTYINEATGKKRQRSMPIRNFTKRSGVTRVAEDLCTNPRHKKYLENIKQSQVEKLLQIIQERLKGLSMDETLEKVKGERSIDPEEDLNQLDDDALNKKKEVMDETFEKNRKKPGDNDFEYEVEVDFDKEGPPIESGWDSENDSDPMF